MSFTDVRPYFRARIKTAAPELVEWKDGFSEDNIPATLIEKKCFHIVVGRFATRQLDHSCAEMSGTATLNLYFDGTKAPQKAIDDIIAKGQAIAIESLKPVNRVTQAGIKQVRMTNFDPSPLSPSNDSVVRLTIEFDLTIVLNIT